MTTFTPAQRREIARIAADAAKAALAGKLRWWAKDVDAYMEQLAARTA